MATPQPFAPQPGLATPSALAEAFKKSGQFDKLRREMLAHFKHSVSKPASVRLY